jgi:hypothetical protein
MPSLHVGRTIGEHRDARVVRADGDGEALGRDRQLDPALRRRRAAAAGLRRGLNHFRDRGDAGDRFLRERADGVGHRADEAAVDVDGAAAHAGDHARFGQRASFEPREDQVALRRLHVLEHAKDVDLEVLHLGALEDRAAGADHSRLDLVDRHQAGGRRHPNPAESGQGHGQEKNPDLHGMQSFIA